MHTLTVDLGERSYPLYIGADLLLNSELLRSHLAGRQLLIVSNTTVAPLYLQRVEQCYAGFDVAKVVLPDGEQFKNLETLNTIFDGLLARNFDRRCTLLALGGGVVGDMTGFAAACYQRGVSFIQLPTTLLAQVDSSVGGKTGVNHPLGKNMIGAFHQPRAVVIDTTTLRSLPERDYLAGLAEVIKYGLIWDESFLSWLESNLTALLARDDDALVHIIRQSCLIKAAIVAEDEREGGVRALLNLGHTFGHAIETACGYGQWLHGEAVAAGMMMAVEHSARQGWLTPEAVARVRTLLERTGLPTTPPVLDNETWLTLMGRDKKTRDGRLRLVLLRSLGKATVSEETDSLLLTATLDECRRAAKHIAVS